jgi:hypothetical protein
MLNGGKETFVQLSSIPLLYSTLFLHSGPTGESTPLFAILCKHLITFKLLPNLVTQFPFFHMNI